MRRRNLIALAAGAGLVIPVLAVAQEPARVSRIGFLMGGTPVIEALRLGAFREALERLGHVDGRNVRIEPHYAEGLLDRLGPMARDLVERQPAVIVCVGSQEAIALQAASRSVPIVFMQAGDPVEQGLVASYARPGGNTTGFTQMIDELDSKRLELLRALAPSVVACRGLD